MNTVLPVSRRRRRRRWRRSAAARPGVDTRPGGASTRCPAPTARAAGRRRVARNTNRSAWRTFAVSARCAPKFTASWFSVGGGQDPTDFGRNARRPATAPAGGAIAAQTTASGPGPGGSRASRRPTRRDRHSARKSSASSRARPVADHGRHDGRRRPGRTGPRRGLGLADVVQQRGRDPARLGVGTERRRWPPAAVATDSARSAGPSRSQHASSSGRSEPRERGRGRPRRAAGAAATPRSAPRDDGPAAASSAEDEAVEVIEERLEQPARGRAC